MRVLFDFFINIARWAWLLKGCTIEANGQQRYTRNHVSVVVERMYD